MNNLTVYEKAMILHKDYGKSINVVKWYNFWDTDSWPWLWIEKQKDGSVCIWGASGERTTGRAISCDLHEDDTTSFAGRVVISWWPEKNKEKANRIGIELKKLVEKAYKQRYKV